MLGFFVAFILSTIYHSLTQIFTKLFQLIMFGIHPQLGIEDGFFGFGAHIQVHALRMVFNLRMESIP